MWPAVAGGALMMASGIGQTMLSAHYNRKAARKAWLRQRKVLHQQLTWRARDARRAGLHPLAALGLSPASGPAVGAGADTSGIGMAGREVGRMIANIPNKQEKEMLQTALEIEKARLESIGLDNVGKVEQIQELRRQRSAPIGESAHDIHWNLPGQTQGTQQSPGGPGVELVSPQVKRSQKQGLESGVNPFEKTWISKEGWLHFTPADREVLEENMAMSIRYYMSQGLNYADGLRNTLKDQRKWLPPAPKGKHWKYHKGMGAWKLEKNVSYHKKPIRRQYEWSPGP